MSNFIPNVMTLGNQLSSAGTSVTQLIKAASPSPNLPGSITAWILELRQASFRGVPFGVLTTESRFGRRQALHEYPFRDVPYVEDIGRAARRISFNAFLISDSQVYGGGDVLAQRELLVAAAEAAGPGTLVHPTLGRLQVSIPDGGLTVRERWDQGRYFEIGLTCIESGQRIFPGVTISTGEAVASAAGAANSAASSSFASRAVADLLNGAAVVKQAVSTVQIWAQKAQLLCNDATNLYDAISNLPGDFGRFFGGRNFGGLTGSTPPVMTSNATIDSLIVQATESRAGVAAAALELNTVAANLGAGASSNSPADVAAAAQSLAAALLAATSDPADALRLLGLLADYFPSSATPSSQIGVSMADIEQAVGDLVRRASVTAMAQAATTYQPSSQNDAANVRATVTGLLDDEITTAGDQGEDDAYNSLKALRVAVVQDLTTRGATLAPITTFKFGAALPALALALRIYRDAGRADQLVTQVNPVHPLFMPTTFKALAS